MVRPKKKSKRVPVRLRHKIEKASAAKQRKERRHAKKHPELHPKKKPVHLNIPNSFPYKDRILAEIEEGRRIREEQKLKAREEAARNGKEGKLEVEDGDGDQAMSEGSDEDESDVDAMEESGDEGGNSAMAALLASARARATEYEEKYGDASGESDGMYESSDGEEVRPQRDSSRKAFDKMFKQVVEVADVVLYVLDARDPEGTRSQEVEREVMAAASGEKRLIFILNKIDLVPPNVLKGWLTYLRRYFPTLPLKASNGAPNAQSFDHKSLTIQGTAAALLRALKSFAHARQLKRSVSVGVIGYPNVGKSSIINALTGRLGGSQGACPTGAEAGVTTSMREVKLDKKLKIIDSPGIVFPDGVANQGSKIEEHARRVLLNTVPPKRIEDPIPAVTLLLQRFSTSPVLLNRLYDVYKVPPLANTGVDALTKNFLIEVARRRGRLGKGGIPNLESAAVAVITDWRDGRIQGWTDPPISAGPDAVAEGIASSVTAAIKPDQKEIVSQWMEEFRLDEFGEETGAADVEMCS